MKLSVLPEGIERENQKNTKHLEKYIYIFFWIIVGHPGWLEGVWDKNSLERIG